MATLKLDPWRPVRRGIDRLLEARAPSRQHPDLTESERLALMRQHGCFSLAYATTKPLGPKGQRVTRAFVGDHGYIAYGEKMGYVLALGDPVCAPDDRAALLDRFLAAFDRPSFVQVSGPTAELLGRRGYSLTPFGVDTVLKLDRYTFDGKHKDSIRYASNWLRKRGFTIVEETGSQDAAAILSAISSEWRSTRVARRREMQFLNRGLPPEPEVGIRVFVLRNAAAKPVAFVLFDPLHRDGRCIGYVTALKRRLDEAGVYAELGLMRSAIETFRSEGLEEVRLGLSPLAPAPEAEAGRPRRLLAFAFRRLYGSRSVNARIFNFKGQAQFKKRFHGDEEPLYVAIARGSSLMQTIALGRLSKLI